jgi:hypothetical protein
MLQAPDSPLKAFPKVAWGENDCLNRQNMPVTLPGHVMPPIDYQELLCRKISRNEERGSHLFIIAAGYLRVI